MKDFLLSVKANFQEATVSFNSDFEEILLILNLQQKRYELDTKMVFDILSRMKREHEQRIWAIENGNGEQ